jgi:ATP-dependent Lhr-like helicase
MPGDTMGADAASAAFGMLHEKVRRWIWQQNWTELRDIQERSIPILLGSDRDLIVGAATASGKTEAAFLPIASAIANDPGPPGGGFEAIYVSPLRALINDQFRRLESLCEDLQIPVVKWHGDVSASVKVAARRKPHGIMLTTPESLEAILVRHGPDAARLFRGLRHVVIDEMHAFIDNSRGRQLQSLLHRLETAAGHHVTRVGLSATLADMQVAKAFIRPSDPAAAEVLMSAAATQDLRLQLRGYLQPAKGNKWRGAAVAETSGAGAEAEPGALGEMHADELAINRHLFQTLRGKRSLVFAGSRQRVELVAVGLGELAEEAGVPNEFFAHHGSLSREYREEAERRMKDPTRPASIVCTTTLELGIDVGDIDEVAALGPGHTVSGMRQRLGRSGRRAGRPAVMRIYVSEMEVTERTHPVDALRPETVQAIAMVNLMLRRWNEPPVSGRLHLSTLVHQVLALIAQHGGVTAQQAWARLGASGIFAGVTPDLFRAVLRRMAHPEVKLIEQAPDGTLLPGEEGEKAMAGRDFYAVFMSPEEFKVITDRGRSLGSVPVTNPLMPQQLIIFGGRRWRVSEVDTTRREVVVAPAYGGRPPSFGGNAVPPADGVIAEMRRIYMADDTPRYLDAQAQGFLVEARATFARLALGRRSACWHDGNLLLFPWTGAHGQSGLHLSLVRARLDPTPLGLAIGIPAEQEARLRQVLAAMAAAPPPDPLDLAALVPEKQFEKYDHCLDEELLTLSYASERIDAARVPVLAAELLAGLPDAEG